MKNCPAVEDSGRGHSDSLGPPTQKGVPNRLNRSPCQYRTMSCWPGRMDSQDLSLNLIRDFSSLGQSHTIVHMKEINNLSEG